MLRINIERIYLKKVLETGKYFVNQKFKFDENEPLLLQLVKRDEPGTIGRVKAVVFFDKLSEDTEGESVRLYSKRWKYAIFFKNPQRFKAGDYFNLKDLILGYEHKYNPQNGIVRLFPEDEVRVRNRIQTYLN